MIRLITDFNADLITENNLHFKRYIQYAILGKDGENILKPTLNWAILYAANVKLFLIY